VVTKGTFVLLAGYRRVLDVSTVIRRNGDGAHPNRNPQVRQSTKVSLWTFFIVPSEQHTISNPQTGHWDELRTAMPTPADDGPETCFHYSSFCGCSHRDCRESSTAHSGHQFAPGRKLKGSEVCELHDVRRLRVFGSCESAA
jgi:hypothetical protein